MATQRDLLTALYALQQQGQSRFAASTVAELLYPNGRTHNANGQVFALSAGVAGRMLRNCAAVAEVESRTWQIVPERLFEMAHSNRSEWSRGFFAAVAILVRQHGDGTAARDLLACGGNPAEADPEDIAVFREHGMMK